MSMSVLPSYNWLTSDLSSLSSPSPYLQHIPGLSVISYACPSTLGLLQTPRSALSDTTATTDHARGQMLMHPLVLSRNQLRWLSGHQYSSHRYTVKRHQEPLKFTCQDTLFPVLHYEEFIVLMALYPCFHPSVWQISKWLWVPTMTVHMEVVSPLKGPLLFQHYHCYGMSVKLFLPYLSHIISSCAHIF